MYQSSVPEQIIKEITGHKSDCVRTYKHTNSAQLMKASASIGGQESVENVEPKEESVKKNVEIAKTKSKTDAWPKV